MRPGWHATWLGVALVLGGCEGRTGSATGAGGRPAFDPGPVPAEHAEGRDLFLTGCTGCHGPAGSGFSGGPPLLDSLYLAGRFPDSSIRRAVLRGAPGRRWDFGDMPAVRTVRPDRIPAVIRYIRWVQRRWVEVADSAAAAPPVKAPPGEGALRGEPEP